MRKILQPAKHNFAALPLALSISLLTLSGCASSGRWLTATETFTSDGFVVRLPQGWKIRAEDGLLTTRDGLPLQRIAIGRLARDQELPHAQKPIAQSGLIQDTVAVIAEDLRSNPNLENQEIIETHPATVGGHPGIKVAYRYRAKSGLTIQGIHYGALVDDSYYYLIYEAAARHYFQRDLDVFEKLKDSFQILRIGIAGHTQS